MSVGPNVPLFTIMLTGISCCFAGPIFGAEKRVQPVAHKIAQARFANLLARHAGKAHQEVMKRGERAKMRAFENAQERFRLNHLDSNHGAYRHPTFVPSTGGAVTSEELPSPNSFLSPGGISMLGGLSGIGGGGNPAGGNSGALSVIPIPGTPVMSSAGSPAITSAATTFSTLTGVSRLLGGTSSGSGVTLGGTPPPSYVQLNATAINPNVPPLLITDLNNIVANINIDLAQLINNLNSGLNNLLNDLNSLYPSP